MNKKISAKIEKIRREHRDLLSIAKSQISENNDAFVNYSNEIIAMLNYDEKSIKKYESVKQAQELITSLTEQILHVQSAEEIVELRKKINYYINKIKAELKRRNVTEESLNNYLVKVTSLRKSIALYIRFLKREDNIAKINTLFTNFDNLTKEELIDFKNCLQKEDRYNRRNLKAFNQGQETQKEADSVSTTGENAEEKSKNFKFGQDTPGDQNTDVENSDANIKPDDNDSTQHDEFDFSFLDSSDQDNEDFESDYYDIKYISEDTPYEETYDFFRNKVNNYNYMFGIIDTIEYDKGKFCANAMNFFRNIPRYIHNKIAIRDMEKEFYCYYSGGDFAGFIEYIKKRNSIQEALKIIFEGTCLFSHDSELLSAHEDCAKWMHDFCVKQSIPIWVRKRQIVPTAAK